MTDLLFSANIVLPIFLLILLGAFLGRIGLLTPAFRKTASKLVFNVSLPVSLFQSVAATDLAAGFSGRFVLYALGSTLVVFGFAWICARLLLRDRAAIGAAVHGSFRGNFAYIGLAVARSMLGSGELTACVMVIAFVVPLYNILGTLILSIYSSGKKATVGSVLLGIIKNPLIIGIVLALPFSFFRWELPAAIDTSFDYIAQLATPLALLLIGANLRADTLRKNPGAILLSANIKILLAPLLGTLGAMAFGFEGEELVTIFIMHGVPSAANTYIMTQNMGGDAESAAGIVMLTTLGSILTLTGGIFLLRHFVL